MLQEELLRGETQQGQDVRVAKEEEVVAAKEEEKLNENKKDVFSAQILFHAIIGSGLCTHALCVQGERPPPPGRTC